MRRKGEVPKEMQGLLESILEEITFQYKELKKQCQNLADIDFSLLQEKASNVVSKEMTASEKKSHEEKPHEKKNRIGDLGYDKNLKSHDTWVISYGNRSYCYCTAATSGAGMDD